MLITLVRTMSGTAHRSTCYSLPEGTRRTHDGREVVKFTVVAPEIEEEDVAAFIAARKMDACRSCIQHSGDPSVKEKKA